ncbi:MAG: hypothetical protein RJA52_1478 [Bacteroidota bacterium]
MFRIFFVLFLSGLIFILGAIILQLVDLYRKRTHFKDRIQSVINFALILLNENQLEIQKILQNINELKSKEINPLITEENKLKAEHLLREFENENSLKKMKQDLFEANLNQLNTIQKNYNLALDMQEKKSQLKRLRKKERENQFDKDILQQWKYVDKIEKSLKRIQTASSIEALKQL